MTVTAVLRGVWAPLTITDTDQHADRLILPPWLDLTEYDGYLSSFNYVAPESYSFAIGPTLIVDPSVGFSVQYQFETVPTGRHGLIGSPNYELVFSNPAPFMVEDQGPVVLY